jgi:hypothetical protein
LVFGFFDILRHSRWGILSGSASETDEIW